MKAIEEGKEFSRKILTLAFLGIIWLYAD